MSRAKKARLRERATKRDRDTARAIGAAGASVSSGGILVATGSAAPASKERALAYFRIRDSKTGEIVRSVGVPTLEERACAKILARETADMDPRGATYVDDSEVEGVRRIMGRHAR